MSYYKAKMHQIRFRLGELTDALAGFNGEGGEGRGRKWEGRRRKRSKEEGSGGWRGST